MRRWCCWPCCSCSRAAPRSARSISALIYFTTALPFLGSGIIVSLVISETIERVDQRLLLRSAGRGRRAVWRWSLLLNTFGGPNTVIAVSVLFAAGGRDLVQPRGHADRAASRAWAWACCSRCWSSRTRSTTSSKCAMPRGRSCTTEQFTKWNSISRIGLAQDQDARRDDLHRCRRLHRHREFRFQSSHARPTCDDLLHQGPGIPYNLRPGAKTLIIGPGGGWDVSRALASGSHDVTGVEINPIIATDDHAAEVSAAQPRVSICGRTCISTSKTAAVSCAAARRSIR